MSSGVELPPRCRTWATTAGRLALQVRACEALEDHREVAGADDTRTKPRLWQPGGGIPSRGTSQGAPQTLPELVTVEDAAAPAGYGSSRWWITTPPRRGPTWPRSATASPPCSRSMTR